MNTWFRLYSEFASDPKVQTLSEPLQRRLVMVFCLRCGDVLGTLCDEEIAFALRISPLELEQTKTAFVLKGFVDEHWNVLNWDKRQFTSDSSTERTRKYRERLRTSPIQSRTSQNGHSDALDQNRTDTEQNRTEHTQTAAYAASVRRDVFELSPPGTVQTSTKIDVEFDERFWPAVWHKEGKLAAKNAYRKARRKYSADVIVNAAIEQGPFITEAARRGCRSEILPATWLNGGRFLDEDFRKLPPERKNGFATHQEQKDRAMQEFLERMAEEKGFSNGNG